MSRNQRIYAKQNSEVSIAFTGTILISIHHNFFFSLSFWRETTTVVPVRIQFYS